MSSVKKPEASIIIPTFNDARNLQNLLKVLVPITPNNCEILIVDDGSADQTAKITNSFPVRYYRLKKNQGPAFARNFGAKEARGKILIFFDSDVIPYKNTLKELFLFFKKNPQAVIVSGFWDKHQQSKSFFPQYKALRDWSYFFNEAAKNNIYCFTPRVAAIAKKTFWQAGGFDTRYRKPDMEDFEFGTRLAKIAHIYFEPKFLVKHEYKGAIVQSRNYFKRAYFFTALILKYHQFCQTVATQSEALNALMAALILVVGFGVFLFPTLILALFLIKITYLFRQRKFIFYFLSERGGIFTLKSLFFNFFLHLVITSAVFYLFLRWPLWFSKRRLYNRWQNTVGF